jgi:hypothetical protein
MEYFSKDELFDRRVLVTPDPDTLSQELLNAVNASLAMGSEVLNTLMPLSGAFRHAIDKSTDINMILVQDDPGAGMLGSFAYLVGPNSYVVTLPVSVIPLLQLFHELSLLEVSFSKQFDLSDAHAAFERCREAAQVFAVALREPRSNSLLRRMLARANATTDRLRAIAAIRQRLESVQPKQGATSPFVSDAFLFLWCHECAHVILSHLVLEEPFRSNSRSRLSEQGFYWSTEAEADSLALQFTEISHRCHGFFERAIGEKFTTLNDLLDFAPASMIEQVNVSILQGNSVHSLISHSSDERGPCSAFWITALLFSLAFWDEAEAFAQTDGGGLSPDDVRHCYPPPALRFLFLQLQYIGQEVEPRALWKHRFLMWCDQVALKLDWPEFRVVGAIAFSDSILKQNDLQFLVTSYLDFRRLFPISDSQTS